MGPPKNTQNNPNHHVSHCSLLFATIEQNQDNLYVASSTSHPCLCALSVVYDSQAISNHKILEDSLQLPQLLAGNFNAIASPFEHKDGSYLNYAAKAKLFSDFISPNHLLSLGTLNLLGIMVRQNLLDSGLILIVFQLIQLGLLISILTLIIIQLAPTLITPPFLTIHVSYDRRNKNFHFDNYWVYYDGYHNYVLETSLFVPLSFPCMLSFTLFPIPKITLLNGRQLVYIPYIDVEILQVEQEI